MRENLAEPLDQQLRQRQRLTPAREMKAKYPLREAKVTVQEVPGAPGSYNAVRTGCGRGCRWKS